MVAIPPALPESELAVFRNPLAAAIAAVCLASPSGASDVVESPVYKSWSGSKVGTAVTIRSVTVMKGQTIESTTRYTLIELDPRKAAVEMAIIGGNGAGNPPKRLEYRRDFPLLPGLKQEDIGKPPEASEQGEEAIEVAGKEYHATWYVLKGQTEAGESIATTWTRPDFPGMLLKSVLKVPAADKVTTFAVIEIKTP